MHAKKKVLFFARLAVPWASSWACPWWPASTRYLPQQGLHIGLRKLTFSFFPLNNTFRLFRTTFKKGKEWTAWNKAKKENGQATEAEY